MGPKPYSDYESPYIRFAGNVLAAGVLNVKAYVSVRVARHEPGRGMV